MQGGDTEAVCYAPVTDGMDPYTNKADSTSCSMQKIEFLVRYTCKNYTKSMNKGPRSDNDAYKRRDYSCPPTQ